MRVVVVGASLAGVRTAQALRRLRYDGDLTLVDGHPAIAPDRPPLSKTFLAGTDAEPRPLLAPAQLDALALDLRLGMPAVALDTAAHDITLADGTRVTYDRLVLACGSAPRTIPTLVGRAGVHLLRTERDATALRAALPAGSRLVVVGGGFIGAEVAWTAHQRGIAVTVVEPQAALMLRGLGPELGGLLTDRHRASGIDVRVGVSVAGLEGDPVTAVQLSDGREVAADVVLVGVGTAPCTGWLTGSGLTLDDGVVCDERLAAVGVPSVWAAGDVTRWRHPRTDTLTRVEHWTNAVEQAPVVAANVLGAAQEYAGLPYVWSDQLGTRLQVVGRVEPGDEVRFVVGGPADERFLAVTGDGEHLHAVVGVGATRELLPYRKLLAAGATWADAVSPGTTPATPSTAP